MLKINMLVNMEFVRETGLVQWLRRTFLRQFSKRILRADNSIAMPTGLRMKLPRTSKFASEAFITECNVDWGSEKLFASHLDSFGVLLDIGANIGYYSLYMLPRVSAVHAFEPDPNAQRALRENLSGYPNAYIHCMAVGGRCGRAQFVCEVSSEISHLADPLMAESGKGSREIDMTTIDRFVAERTLSVTGIKIDVEGADIDVIEGGLTTLGSQFPLVLTETAPGRRLFDLIRTLGYRVFAFVKYPKTARFEFREIFNEGNPQTKMLFLVPERLHREFERLVVSPQGF